MAKIIVIDDDQSIRETICSYLKRKEHISLSAENGVEGFELIKAKHPDLVISDIRMPELDGLGLLEKVKEFDPSIRMILMTAYDDMNTTISAIRKGAYDYLEKPLELNRLDITLERALENKELSRKLQTFVEVQPNTYDIENLLIGKSRQMKDIYKKIGQVADNKVTVLIQGESGTGKELVARAIHFSGVTQNEPFVAVNCTALSESLLESELFGHVKGAFTGAVKDKKGKFELAGTGTIFLDEISEISPNIQVKLLRILQEKEFEKVGGESTIQMNARVIAATNRDLQKMVAEGKFREDLFFRLSVVTFNIPPLRERKSDIPILINHFLNKINAELHKYVTKIPSDSMDLLTNHQWTGNVRELENTLMQAVVLSSSDVLQRENILLRQTKRNTAEFEDVTKYSLADVEKIHIQNMLKALNWNKPEAAKRLGISLPTLYSKIELYSIKKKY